MEPVPETESLERFRSPPLPTLRLQHPSDLDLSRKPPTVRRSTEPLSPSSPSWSSPTNFSLPYRPRNASPLSGSHTRSKSAASLAPPTMSRTRSMPGLDGTGRVLSLPLLRPASPIGSPNRQRQRRKPADEVFPPVSPIRSSVFENDTNSIPEGSASPTAANTIHHRRTSSPFRHSIPTAYSISSSTPSTPSSVATSPTYRYETNSNGYSFPSYYSSSIPSTPTSVRSRSPSISSLETIPDSPDAEEAALEAERIAKLRAAAEGSDSEESIEGTRSRNSLDVPLRGRTLGMGSKDKRKRWSVCGAERRGDLDLETIWED
ncbi:uncharacterized protein BCR38DRAFT_338707 [Pseudomassariella vexata]|uniref:Basic proline-rich protein n=1 Tax=Pseudomassariella vexata TaxID=1141098 RepID=A0A1Y2E529_9PEZI|nr:uncharacterized protein BCR38DRAFT_338707 [Pseudomassariella vexata]ORY66396.1 hypothetical protein BCR38DRAFT_338707 [Pseudomassariella vexata]